MLNANIDLSIPFSENVHEHQAKSGIEIGAQNNHQNVWNKPVDMGTSIMAVEFDGGVIIGADSRTSMGPYVSNRVSNKLTEIHDNIYVCRSGSAADTQALADVVAYNIGLISIEEGEAPQVKSTARLFQHLCYDYKNNLTAGIICAGWDRVNGGSVYGIPLGGTMVKQPFAIGGSGSTFIYGYCDANYRENMSRDECVEFVKNALALAMARDGSSGGVIRYAIITKDGVEKQTIPGDQLPRFYAATPTRNHCSTFHLNNETHKRKNMTESHLMGDHFASNYDKQVNNEAQNGQQYRHHHHQQQQQQKLPSQRPEIANAFANQSFGNIRSNSAPPVDNYGATPHVEEGDPESYRYDLKYAEYYYSQKPLDPRLPPPLVNWKHTLWDGDKRKEENHSFSPQVVQPSPQRPNSDLESGGSKSSPWAIPSTKPGLVNRIQKDFPRTPSPVYNQNHHSLFSLNENSEVSNQNGQTPLSSSPHSPQPPQTQPQPSQPSHAQHPLNTPGSPQNQPNQQPPVQQPPLQQQPQQSANPMFLSDNPNNVDDLTMQMQNMSMGDGYEHPSQYPMSGQQMTPPTSGTPPEMKEYDPMTGAPTNQYIEYQQPPEVMTPYGPYPGAYGPNVYQPQIYAAGPQYGMVNPMVGFGPPDIKDGRKIPYYQPGAYEEGYVPYGAPPPPPAGRGHPPFQRGRHPHHGKGGRDHHHHHHHHHHPEFRRRPRKKHLEREDNIPRSKLMEEFRGTKSKKWEIKDIKQHIVEFSRDQHGSRFIQQKLENASDDDKKLVFSEVHSQALELMTDVFGNYVIQKLFEHGLSEHRRALANVLKGNVLNLTLQTYGCRVIQKALEVMDDEEQEIVAKELEGHVVKCVEDQNGNHVIQKCIEQVSSPRVQFIVDAFSGSIHEQGVHAYGCRVIQRILEYCTDSQVSPILDEILDEANNLIRDQYGNYVVQHVLQNGQAHSKSNIIAKMHGQLLELSQHKFASNVIERCFQVANKKEKQNMIDECLKPQSEEEPASAPLFKMMKDQYANYVVQKFIDMADEKQRKQIIDSIRPHVTSLKKFTYGKHIIARLGMSQA